MDQQTITNKQKQMNKKPPMMAYGLNNWKTDWKPDTKISLNFCVFKLASQHIPSTGFLDHNMDLDFVCFLGLTVTVETRP